VRETQNLETTLQELRTAEEELRAQNDELRAAQAALQDERRRYADLFEVAPDSLFVTDVNGRIVEANSAALEMLEASPGAVAGQTLAEFLPPEAQDRLATALRALRHGEAVVESELPLRPRGGEERLVHARAVRFGEGEVRWALRDVTKQRATEAELRAVNVQLETRVTERSLELDRQRALLEAVLEQNPVGIAIVDEAEQVVLANAEAKRILGIAGVPAHAEGYKGAGRRYAEEEWPVIRSLRAGEVVIGERARIVRPNGEQAVVEINSGPIRDGTGRTVAAVSVFRDVTLAEQREQAEREFVSNAAHELRTPLAAIVGAVEVLQAGAKEDPAERDRFLAHLEQQCHRLERLISALLVLARVQTRAEAPRLEIVELFPLFEEIAESLHPAPRVSVEVDCPEEIAVFANRALLEEAVANLAANAIKFTLRGTITLSATEAEPGVVEVAVRDTGRGMKATDRKRAVERFFQGDDDTKGGFGLGLAIVAAAADAMGARLEIESAPRRGTTVRMRLRAARVLAA
jgi:two-component system, OmpR family, phosphate regulon sensor histidine kinase PhoR